MDHKIKEKSKNRIGTTGKSIQHDFFIPVLTLVNPIPFTLG